MGQRRARLTIKVKFMKNKTFKKRKNTNSWYIAPHKHNHAKKKKQSTPPLRK